MRRALALAKRGFTAPNPMVGAVLVKDGRIVGEGYHRRAGMPHAEVEALRRAGEQARGATLYVTLEPCSHWGRTPPCADAIIEAGVRCVYAAMQDPNPLVAGRGFARLREAGIEVQVGTLEAQARQLNEIFVKYHTTGMPFVTAKAAMSLDGKIATHTGDSKWITDEPARRVVHRLRARHDAVMVGVGTVLRDDPLLTVRLPRLKHPLRRLRVVVDSRLRCLEEAQVLRVEEAPTLIATTEAAPLDKAARLRERGVEVVVLPAGEGGVDLCALMRTLAERGVTGVLCEGGGTLLASLFAQRLVDKVVFFYAPRILGGREAPTAVEGAGFSCVEESLRLDRVYWRRIGRDLMVQAYPVWEPDGTCSPAL
ncbi:MAG: bifunctional diaminohydroxyphosphoribosylaminopyrimidine deaminase/5-amino-6-(5-phosphoribosylamino)uracil reductase RibD [Armatimonadota bacterium]|nr:bifunctional diaminohydroxyphosphoribosylaminopyrimidine deaminase/5-amino-6-(5-phosphoribosylamino)uracil reductase RibD [bacterium]MDW8289179.1 bifunctional diaminohydroxyphosphoribosylaminopyrimidine deaminase/5-amino-6-(5-phosphoribosylamino)uracil reductase RibD [Armatimonadota bacterium]